MVKGITFSGFDGLHARWDESPALVKRVNKVSSLVVDCPAEGKHEVHQEDIVTRSLDNARHNKDALLPVLQLMRGHLDKVPHLDPLQEELKKFFINNGVGNPGEKMLKNQAWSIRYIFGAVKHLMWKEKPPCVACFGLFFFCGGGVVLSVGAFCTWLLHCFFCVFRMMPSWRCCGLMVWIVTFGSRSRRRWPRHYDFKKGNAQKV